MAESFWTGFRPLASISPYERSEFVGRVERVRRGGAGSLYHLNEGLADRKASLYWKGRGEGRKKKAISFSDQ